MLRTLARLVLCAIAFVPQPGATAGEPALPAYRAGAAIEGNLRFSAEDGLTKLAVAWAEGFGEACPAMNLEVAGKFSPTVAIDALAGGTYDLLPLGREFRADEIDRFRKAAGQNALAVCVALRPIALFVAADNPVASLTLAQLDGIYSTTRKRGAPADVTTWGQLGLEGAWAERAITPLGRDGATATCREFQEAVLSGGEYGPSVVVVPGDTAIAEMLKRVPAGIGYDRPGTATAGARAVRLVGDDGKPYEPTEANVQGGKYPIVRPFLVYLNRAPGKPLRPPVREFLRFLLSRQGQDIMAKGGYVPVGAALAAKERAKVE